MIRAFYNSSLIPLSTGLDNVRECLNDGGVTINNINKVRNESAICIDPYAKLKKGIVPDKGCYSHLRSLSHYLFEKLPSTVKNSRDVNSDQVSGLREDLLYEKSIIEMLLSDDRAGKKDVLQSIKNACVSKQPGSNVINISTRYASAVSVAKPEWCGDILLNCRDEIIESSHALIQFKDEFISFNIKGHQSLCYQRSLNIDEIEIDKYAVNYIFKSFEKVFNEDKTTGRFLVAIIAVRLRDYWCSNPPSNVRRNEIDKCTPRHPNLFITGDIIANLLAGDDVKIAVDKQLSFMHKFDGMHINKDTV